MHGALSWHRTWVGARWATRGDEDLVIFGPYWPDWQKRAICRIWKHRVYRWTASWCKERSMPPTRYYCARCGVELGRSHETFGKIVRYGDE